MCDIEFQVEPWREKLWATLDAALRGGSSSSNITTSSSSSNSSSSIITSSTAPPPSSLPCPDIPRPPGPPHSPQAHGSSPRLQVSLTPDVTFSRPVVRFAFQHFTCQDYPLLHLLPSSTSSGTAPQHFYSLPSPFSSSSSSSSTTTTTTTSPSPSLLPVTAAEILCGGAGSDTKTVVKLELELPPDNSFTYQPGDSIGIFPPNADDDVQLVLQRCRSPLCSQFELPPVPPAASRGIINSETFLKWGVDLRACVTKKVSV